MAESQDQPPMSESLVTESPPGPPGEIAQLRERIQALERALLAHQSTSSTGHELMGNDATSISSTTTGGDVLSIVLYSNGITESDMHIGDLIKNIKYVQELPLRDWTVKVQVCNLQSTWYFDEDYKTTKTTKTTETVYLESIKYNGSLKKCYMEKIKYIVFKHFQDCHIRVTLPLKKSIDLPALCPLDNLTPPTC